MWDHGINLFVESDKFPRYIGIPKCEKNKSFWETLAQIKFLFSRNSYVCPIWIFKFDTVNNWLIKLS
jgi:hypothetical protein